jgi:nucleoside-diphosphate-sugar epimerase
VADVNDRSSLASLPKVSTLLWAVGFDRSAGRTIDEVYVAGLRNVLEMLPGVERVIYVSSTGVYGDAAGDWVDEQTPCRPTRPGGIACLRAEELLAADRLGYRSIVLRMAGIYGPGRVPRSEAIQSGEPIAAPADGYLNLIHVDDAAQVVLSAERDPPLPRTYVVSDGHPVERREYYRELARLLGAPEPQFITPDANTPAAERAAADKRVSNRRMLEELSVTLRYPSYREGLVQIVGR